MKTNLGLNSFRAAAPLISNSSFVVFVVFVVYFSFNFALAEQIQIGPVRYCQRTPQFVSKTAVSMPAFMTSHRTLMGLVLFDGTKPFENQKPYRDPSWSKFGWLGPMAFDRAGNIYLTSVPHVNVLSNPLSQQNDIFKVGSTSGSLERLLSLPVKNSPSLSNPYGAVGITYDCDTDILYVATLSGSTFEEEKGGIFAIALKDNRIVDSITGFDPLGVTIFRTKAGKRLYAGSARRSDVLALKLNEDGSFSGDPVLLFNFDKFHETRARKFSFDKELNLSIETIEFNYNLIASTQLLQKKYIYSYDRTGDRWVLTSDAH